MLARRLGLALVVVLVVAPAPSASWGAAPSLVRVSTDVLPFVSPPPSGNVHVPRSQAEPHLAIDPADPNHLVGAWQEDRRSIGGARAIVVATSFDGGRSWRQRVLPRLTRAAGGPWESATDPWVAFGPRGRVYVATLAVEGTLGAAESASAVLVSASRDGGRSFAAPRSVVDDRGRTANDKEAITADAWPTSRRRGSVYVTWDRFSPSGTGLCEGRQPALISRLTPGARGWSRPSVIHDPGPRNQAAGVVSVVRRDGTVVAVWLEFTNRPGDCATLRIRLRSARSRDGGRSWSRAVDIARLPPGPAGIGPQVPELRTGEGLPYVALDPARDEWRSPR